MAVEGAGEFAVFFNTDDFAIPATYMPQVGAQTSVSVIFDNDHLAVDMGVGIPVSSLNPRGLLRLSDIPNCRAGDKLRIGKDLYLIRDPRPDGNGLVAVELKKDGI